VAARRSGSLALADACSRRSTAHGTLCLLHVPANALHSGPVLMALALFPSPDLWACCLLRQMKDKSDKKPRLPSAYNLFVKDESSKLRKEGNHATQQDLMRDLGTKWRELPTHEKEKYNARANAVAGMVFVHWGFEERNSGFAKRHLGREHANAACLLKSEHAFMNTWYRVLC
jgi:hypothetical protein